MTCRLNNKLCKRYFRPYRITKKISVVVLPPGSRIHNTFHISKLKAYKGVLPPPEENSPILAIDNQPILYPIALIDFKKIYLNGKQTYQVLVHWSGSTLEDASWENLEDSKNMFLVIVNEDMTIMEGEEHDTIRPDTTTIVREVLWTIEKEGMDAVNLIGCLGLRSDLGISHLISEAEGFELGRQLKSLFN